MFGIVKIKMMEMPRKLLQKCPWCKRVLMTSGNKLRVKLVVIMRFYMEKEGTKSQEAPDAPLKPPNPAQNKVACEICGLFNHLTKDCGRMMCEICGYNNHTAYDCKRCGL